METAQSLKVENLLVDKINGVDIFEYIKDQLATTKIDLEGFIEGIASRKHVHDLEEVQGLLEALQSLEGALQPRGHYARDDHRHKLGDILDLGSFVDSHVKEALNGYAKADHTHKELEDWAKNLLVKLTEINELVEIALTNNKAHNISINDLYNRIETLEGERPHTSIQINSLHKRVHDLEKREPIEIVLKARDEEEIIIPIKAGGMRPEIRATADATAKLYIGSEIMQKANGGEIAKVIVNKPCLVHIIFRE